jgi:hypothetical protein
MSGQGKVGLGGRHGSWAKARREKEGVRRQRNVDKLDGKVQGLLPTTVLIWNVDSTRCGSASLREATKERAKGWSADHIPSSVNIQKIQDDVVELWNVVKSQCEICEGQKNHIKA